MPTTIYALAHPITKTIRYVGKCVQPISGRRLAHETKARTGRIRTRLAHWIKRLQSKGLRPHIFVLEVVTCGSWQSAERKWIAKYRQDGRRLLNLHPGGNGAHTRAHLAPQFVAMLGKVPDSHIANLAGLCRETITYHRHRYDVPACADKKYLGGKSTQFKKGQAAHNRIDVPKAIIDQLGKVDDHTLARKAGVGRCVIARRRKELGIASCRRRPSHAGARHYNAKLSNRLVRWARSQHEAGRSCSDLARVLGISQPSAWEMLHYKTWTEV